MADDLNQANNVQPQEIVGVPGLKRMGGRVYEKWLPELQGERGRRVTRQRIDSDPIISAFLLAVDLLCRNVDWHTVPVSSEKEDADAAQFLDECHTDMSSTWRDMVSEILSFVSWGWQWSEIVYKVRGGDSNDPTRRSKYDDNRIGWRKVSIRAQETLWEWEFDDDGVKAMKQMAPPDYVMRTIPIEKSLLFRVRSRKGNPEPLAHPACRCSEGLVFDAGPRSNAQIEVAQVSQSVIGSIVSEIVDSLFETRKKGLWQKSQSDQLSAFRWISSLPNQRREPWMRWRVTAMMLS